MVVAPEYLGLQFESGGRHSRLECRPIGCTACFGAGRCRPARCTPGLGAGRCLRHRCTPGPVPASACGTGALQVSVPAAPFALQVSVQASACGTGALRAPVPTFFATLQHLAPVQVALCAAWLQTVTHPKSRARVGGNGGREKNEPVPKSAMLWRTKGARTRLRSMQTYPRLRNFYI